MRLKKGVSISSMDINNVQDLMNNGGSGWNCALVWNISKRESAHKILSMYIPQVQKGEDEIVWNRYGRGTINVKDAYTLLMESQRGQSRALSNGESWNRLWAMLVRPKWKVFIWTLFNKAQALNPNLEKGGIATPRRCYFRH